jgi:hypothetical protein
MSFHNTRRAFVLADIEPTVAVAGATRWEREMPLPPPTSKPTSYDLMKQARLMRSAYQQELMRRFAALIFSWLYSSRVSRATASAQRRDSR